VLRTHIRRAVFGCMVLTTIAADSAQGQDGMGGAAAAAAHTFLDEDAAALLARARTARRAADGSLRSYTALVQSRMAAGVRMPLKDRMMIRFESAARVRWSRDSDDIIQVLASRSQAPDGTVEPDPMGGPHARPFDPSSDRLFFGFFHETRTGDNFWIEHPLGADAERHYRYQSGDSLTIRLQDGRVLQVVELRVIPRRASPHSVRGVLWIDAGSGALVRAAFRLAATVDLMRDTNALDAELTDMLRKAPLLTPLEFDLSLLTVEYSLWDMRHWLPRTMRVDGVARAGLLTMPASFDVSYEVLDVTSDGEPQVLSEAELFAQTLAEWTADGRQRTSTGVSWFTAAGPSDRRVRTISPRDQSELIRSELLPPPIWEDMPGFATEAELWDMYRRVAGVAGPARPDLPVRFGWGYRELGMLRYNRVEALSVGARITVPLPQATLAATARLGAGDMHPNVEVMVLPGTLQRTLELRAYHQLAAVDDAPGALGFGNSLAAFFFGRDEGQYFRTTGASLTVAPPAFRRRSWDLEIYAEAHDAVERGTHVALPRVWTNNVFGDNIDARETTQLGARLHARPWWGSDPLGPQFGLDLLLQGELVEFAGARSAAWHAWPAEHVLRGRVTARGAAPLPARLRIGAEAAVGAARGSLADEALGPVPVQRLFYLGGASTLRGHEPGALRGRDMARGRVELAYGIAIGKLALFTDYARISEHPGTSSELWAAGAGVSVLDGLVRLDLARGVGARRGEQAHAVRRGWRLDLHMDTLL
jgi:hypothetical protein